MVMNKPHSLCEFGGLQSNQPNLLTTLGAFCLVVLAQITCSGYNPIGNNSVESVPINISSK